MLSGAANTVPESFAVNLLGRIHIIFSFPGGYFLNSPNRHFSQPRLFSIGTHQCPVLS
jgi:hypothetical protein